MPTQLCASPKFKVSPTSPIGNSPEAPPRFWRKWGGSTILTKWDPPLLSSIHQGLPKTFIDRILQACFTCGGNSSILLRRDSRSYSTQGSPEARPDRHAISRLESTMAKIISESRRILTISQNQKLFSERNKINIAKPGCIRITGKDVLESRMAAWLDVHGKIYQGLTVNHCVPWGRPLVVRTGDADPGPQTLPSERRADHLWISAFRDLSHR